VEKLGSTLQPLHAHMPQSAESLSASRSAIKLAFADAMGYQPASAKAFADTMGYQPPQARATGSRVGHTLRASNPPY
jgi:hypothetical protein